MKQDTSYLTRKLVFAFFFIFYLLFLKYEPYSYADRYMQYGTLEYLFFLFFWIFNQTLTMVHEAGHGICYLLPYCPKFITALMGTVFQIGFPVLAALYYKKRKNILGFYIALFFVGFTTAYTAWYISTANQGLLLPASKSFLGVDSYHDFYYILNTLRLLKFYAFIAFIVKIVANLTMIYAFFKILLYSLEDK